MLAKPCFPKPEIQHVPENELTVHVSPSDGNIQDHKFQEVDTSRSVNYLHRYDWMHPSASYRLQNEYISKTIRNIKEELASKPSVDYERCKDCRERHEADPDNDRSPPCPQCDALEQEAVQERAENDAELRVTLKKWEMTNPEFSADEHTGRCHWCGILLPGEAETRTHRLLRYARVDIPGIGPLPCLTGFDHEQNEICPHCAAEMGSLLKEKRRFQALYELSAKAEPHGCNSCGIRECVQFKPAMDRTGVICLACYLYKKDHGLDPDPPRVGQKRLKEFVNAIISNSNSQGIRWDKIANNPRVNPNFVYTAQGLHSQWLNVVRNIDTPALNTYILLQHNHLTRRTNDWEFYTCNARSPTHAALYFARFVSLYKKRPMTYLYIRQLETWNIPEPRGDEWEDLSLGLQTFEQLKNRIRIDLLNQAKDAKKNPPADNETKLKRIKEALESRMHLFSQGNTDESKKELSASKAGILQIWKLAMESELGPENSHLASQLPFDDLEVHRYMNYGEAWSAVRNESRDTDDQTTLQPEEEHQRADMSRVIEKVENAVGLVAGIASGIPLDPPEQRTSTLPTWARIKSRDIVRKSVADLKAWYAYERIERDKEMETLGSNQELKESRALEATPTLEDTADRQGFAFRTNEEREHLLLEKIRGRELSQELDNYVPKLEVDGNGYRELPLWVQPLRPNTLRSICRDRPLLNHGDDEQDWFIKELMKLEKEMIEQRAPVAALSPKISGISETFEGRPTFPRRTDLPQAYDRTPTPSANYPLHLLPVEYQVHVYQAILEPETRTVSVRIVRTERYKRQGDAIQGGGPIQVPTVIDKSKTRGFYRDSNRADPFSTYMPCSKNSVFTKYGDLDRSVVALRSKKPKPGRSGVEYLTIPDTRVRGQKAGSRKKKKRSKKDAPQDDSDDGEAAILGPRGEKLDIEYEPALDEEAVLQYLQRLREEGTAHAPWKPPTTEASSTRKRDWYLEVLASGRQIEDGDEH
ncbi:hypothetical protein BG006_005974 [Podila minutissima]|uniref:Uncharacterized protein n=1 Tax=Podila minutissima TaxID=64525 RepID=A0A9P5SLS2_9FUNG|nr:hypothetical protein BG006_005974 [Podila minutissima]